MNPLSPLAMLGLKALAAAAALAALLWAIHALDMSRQQIGYDRRVAEDNAALIKAQADALDQERHLNRKLEDARNEATKRDQTTARTAAAAGLAVDGLRHELAAYRRSLPADPARPGDPRADAIAELFGDCAGHYRDLAEKADRHASDARTLSEGWPK